MINNKHQLPHTMQTQKLGGPGERGGEGVLGGKTEH